MLSRSRPNLVGSAFAEAREMKRDVIMGELVSGSADATSAGFPDCERVSASAVRHVSEEATIVRANVVSTQLVYGLGTRSRLDRVSNPEQIAPSQFLITVQ